MNLTAPSHSEPRVQTPAGRAGNTLAGSFDSFLQLLGAQLEHQDPLSPLDATQFTSQLVQFSTVEQAIRTNTQLERLTGLVESSSLTAALHFIGLEVGFTPDQLHLAAEGDMAIDYELPRTADQVTVTIRDARGVVVHEGAAPAHAGSHRTVWDGRGADGKRAATGLYRVEIRATDAAGHPLEVLRQSRGRVDGIDAGAEGLSLKVGGVPVPLERVTTVSRPAAL